MMLILCSTPCRMTSLGADCPIIVTRRGATICDKMSKGGDGLTGYGLDKANLPLSSAYLVKLLLKLCPITFHFTWVVKNGHIRPKALFRDTPFVRFRWCARCQVPAPGTWIFRCQVLCVRWHERWASGVSLKRIIKMQFRNAYFRLLVLILREALEALDGKGEWHQRCQKEKQQHCPAFEHLERQLLS